MRARTKISKIRMLLLLSMLAHSSFWLSSTAVSQAFIPDDENYVVENLSSAIVGLSRQIRAGDARQRSIAPETGNLFSQIVESYSLAASSGDPRAYGRVSALINQWPAQSAKPALIHVISASVLQHNHKFSDALAELDRAFSVDSSDPQLNMQIQMIRAQIGLVTAEYDVTRDSCNALMTLASEYVYLNCVAQLDGVTGKAEQAFQAVVAALSRIQPGAQRISTQERIELAITAATLAHRLGDYISAQNYYRQVLVQSPQNFYTLVNYANFLLEQNRANELLNLLALYPEETRSTELNILMAEAFVLAAESERAEQIMLSLGREFELAFLRNEAIPHKEYARYSLFLKPQPVHALNSALANWSEQKEPSDALLLARAAVLNNDKSVLHDLHRWVEKYGTQDKQLESIFRAQGVQS